MRRSPESSGACCSPRSGGAGDAIRGAGEASRAHASGEVLRHRRASGRFVRGRSAEGRAPSGRPERLASHGPGRAEHLCATGARLGRDGHHYDDTISLGGHPNQAGSPLGSEWANKTDRPSRSESASCTPFRSWCWRQSRPLLMWRPGVAKIVGTMYPERFRIASLDEEVNRLIQHSAEVFGARARALRRQAAGSTRTRPE